MRQSKMPSIFCRRRERRALEILRQFLNWKAKSSPSSQSSLPCSYRPLAPLLTCRKHARRRGSWASSMASMCLAARRTSSYLKRIGLKGRKDKMIRHVIQVEGEIKIKAGEFK